MKQRDFRFESLLKYRGFLEERMKHEFRDIAERLDIEEKRLFALEEIWQQAVEELKDRQMREVQPHEILMYHTYLREISHEIEIQHKRVVETREVYHEKRESLIETSQERKMVEKVKEKDAQDEIDHVKREDKKSLDETAKNRYMRENC